MKSTLVERHLHLSSHRKRLLPFLAVLVLAPTLGSWAGDAKKTVVAEEAPPLPLHQIEGNGGIFSTLSAYIVNPPAEGDLFGLPAIGFAYVSLGHGKDLQALTVTEAVTDRLELGYGYNNLNLGNLPLDVFQTTGSALNLEEDSVSLHNFNARLQVLKENDFNTGWIPALTFGAHFKSNETHQDLNAQLAGTLTGIGVPDNQGVDFTLYASKLFKSLPLPVLVEVGGRATEGVWNGLLGFTNDYSYLFEGNVVIFLTGNLALAGEYKQQLTDYTAIPGLIGTANDWWTVDLAYIVNSHFTVAAGYGNFGTVLNNDANGVWGITTKYEF